MKSIYNIKIVLLVVLLAVMGCRTSKKSSGYLNVQPEARKSGLQINLKSPINTASKEEINRSVYGSKTYFVVQEKSDQFKDNAPFIEYLEGGTRERLWFTSSRADEYSYGKKRTNHHQQLYFTERQIGAGVCPGEGWGEVVLFKVDDENPLLNDYPEALAKFKANIEAFNKAQKGAVTIAGDQMIVSCDQIGAGIMSEFKNLYSLTRVDGKFIEPKPLMSISNPNTWESQPCLSPNGKHLFFVSNRKIDRENGTYSSDESGSEIHLFYSFFSNGEWGQPKLVKELCSDKNEITPHIALEKGILLFSSNRDGNYDLYEVPILLNDEQGGYQVDKGQLQKFDRQLIDLCDAQLAVFSINDNNDQTYPYYYYNVRNRKVPQAMFWASNDPEGYGSFDIFGCAMPFNVKLNVVLADKSEPGLAVENPVIEINGAKAEKVNQNSISYDLYSGLNYQVQGGSTASLYLCDRDPRYIMIGYSEIKNQANAADRTAHTVVLTGPSVKSEQTRKFGNLPVFNLLSDTIINDTIWITKAWSEKPACPEVLNIPPKHRQISYFQTGFWEVNTSENLERDLELLHEGYEVTPSGDIYNPQGRIKFHGSDYRVNDWESLLYPINTKDNHRYGIAQARWIELHPNNSYWGDRPDYGESSLAERMKGRKDRINQYKEYAQKVDENLAILTNTIKDEYISFLDLHKNAKPRLLIEIFAVSDQREVTRGWYIGDTVSYRESKYNGKSFDEPKYVKIIPPKVNESTKTVEEVVSCSIDLNEKGNNGCKLGLNSERSELNTNLSRLRAYYGYKEVLKRLTDSEAFNNYMKAGKVALPDNQVNYDDAQIIIITRGERQREVDNPKLPYPKANNPNNQGYYDFDEIRKMVIQIRLLMDEQPETKKNFCCWREAK